jgi:catalase
MLPIEGAAGHWDHRVDDDHWEQPGALFRNMSPEQKQALCDNTARNMRGIASHIQERHIANCTRADPAYGVGVAKSLSRLK